jgi:hypothetical protein
MKRFILVSLSLLLVGFLTTGCGKGEEKATETSTEKKVKEEEKTEDLYLTEKEVIAFTSAYPVFVEITKKKEKDIEPLADKEDLLSSMKYSGELKEYKDEMDAALKEYGFTLESFGAAYGKIMAAYAYGQMQGATGEMMKKMLDNPDVPDERKEEIRKSIKEAEESEEMKACKENWEIVKKHKEELENLLKEK